VATDLPSLTVAAETPPPGPSRGWRGRGWPALASACLIADVNILVISGFRLPLLGAAVGFWFLLVQPVYLLYTTSLWRGSPPAERLGYSLTSILLVLMVTGLGINTVLPLLGMQRPLDPVPVLLLGDGLNVSLYCLRLRLPADRLAWPGLPAIGRKEGRLLVGSALCVALAVLGANRLNNGAGDQLSVAALAISALMLVLLLFWRQQVRETITCATIYLLSLSLLLMTSLRGWFVTGHDIQTEYQVFQLTAVDGRWNISALHDAYNACLSITILPTELAQVVHVDDPYIYKVFFQLIFAVCPVLVYAIARRFWSVSVSILGAILFIGFPTFFTDMPFINRQEIALLFVCVAVLAIINDSWSLRRRQLTLFVACVGAELSHYSTMYLLLGTLIAAWLARRTMELYARYRLANAARGEAPLWAAAGQAVSIGPIIAAVAVVFAWGYFATDTATRFFAAAGSTFSGLVGRAADIRAGDVGYSILFWKTPGPQQILNDYSRAAHTTVLNSPNPTAGYIFQAGAVYQAKAVSPPLLPITAAGRLLSDIGVPVADLNSAVRLGAAEAEQLFIVAGLVALLLYRRFRGRVSREFYSLCIGSGVLLVGVTLLPNLSVDYGILRVFQEALIVLAPVLVAGAIATCQIFGEAWAPRIVAAMCVGIYVSTTGLLPQVLGGYPAQLSLNNSGVYYDSYYMHPQEVAAVQWLSQLPQLANLLPSGVQATHSQDEFLFTNPSDVNGQQYIEDAYPPLVRTDAWVILDYSIVHTGLASASYDGDLILYRYPVALLSNSKNLVYNNGGAEIYR
jgi:uncharacterized membrane protein